MADAIGRVYHVAVTPLEFVDCALPKKISVGMLSS
jgi:hypothetical protein